MNHRTSQLRILSYNTGGGHCPYWLRPCLLCLMIISHRHYALVFGWSRNPRSIRVSGIFDSCDVHNGWRETVKPVSSCIVWSLLPFRLTVAHWVASSHWVIVENRIICCHFPSSWHCRNIAGLKHRIVSLCWVICYGFWFRSWGKARSTSVIKIERVVCRFVDECSGQFVGTAAGCSISVWCIVDVWRRLSSWSADAFTAIVRLLERGNLLKDQYRLILGHSVDAQSHHLDIGGRLKWGEQGPCMCQKVEKLAKKVKGS